MATASINNAIEFYRLFKEIQKQKQAENPDFVPLNIACVFSPPAEGNKDVQQNKEDLTQEKEDNKQKNEKKKKAVKEIIADYNTKLDTNHDINNFDLYYTDVSSRIKKQTYSN